MVENFSYRMLTTLLPLLPLLFLPGRALCSQKVSDGESGAHLLPQDGSGDPQPVWVHGQDQKRARPTGSVSVASLKGRQGPGD